MTRLVRAELLKVRTTKLGYWLGLVVAVLAALTVAGTVFGPERDRPGFLSTPEGIRAVFASASAGGTLAMVMGIVAMAGEWRHKTATAVFLAEPRRGRVVAAKVIAQALLGLAYGVLAALVTLLTAVICLNVKNVDYSVTADGVPTVLVGSMLATAIYGVLGVGYGALVRNQIAAIVSGLLWTTVADGLVVTFLPTIGRWTPAGATAALTRAAAGNNRIELLPVWAGALVLSAYGVLFAAIGVRTMVSRDVT
ncbi:MAG: hypothetical protein ABIM89_05765 [Mycobacteriales bacterium]